MTNNASSIVIATLVLGVGLVLATTGCKPRASGGAAAESGSDYYCPMHPEVSQDEPGKCPTCGMDLVTGIGSSDYYCPMHPEVRQSDPGKCPTCGMALELEEHAH